MKSNMNFKRSIAPILLRSRFVSIFLCFVLLCSFALPVGAVGIDYNDYVTSCTVDGYTDTVIVTIPQELCGVTVSDMNGEQNFAGVTAGNLLFVYEEKAVVSLFVPGSGITETWLDLSNIPDGTEFSFSGSLSIEKASTSNPGPVEFLVCKGVQYYDVNGHLISSVNTSSASFSVEWSFLADDFPFSSKVIIDKPENAVYCCVMATIEVALAKDLNRTAAVNYSFNLPTITMSISALDRLAEETGKTNEILTEVQKQLAEQGKTLDEVFQQQQQTNEKLDDILHGTPEQNQQAQDSLGGLKDSTDRLDELGDIMASVDKPVIDSNQISAGNLVPQTSLTVLSSPFQALWENNQLLAMLTIVVTIVLVSWVFFGKKG